MTILFFLHPYAFRDSHDYVPGGGHWKKRKKRKLTKEVEEALEALQLYDLQKQALDAEIYRLKLDKNNKAELLALQSKKIEIEKLRDEEEFIIMLLMDQYDD